ADTAGLRRATARAGERKRRHVPDNPAPTWPGRPPAATLRRSVRGARARWAAGARSRRSRDGSHASAAPAGHLDVARSYAGGGTDRRVRCERGEVAIYGSPVAVVSVRVTHAHRLEIGLWRITPPRDFAPSTRVRTRGSKCGGPGYLVKPARDELA